MWKSKGRLDHVELYSRFVFILAGLRFHDKLDKPYMIRPKTTAIAEVVFGFFSCYEELVWGQCYLTLELLD